jgi:transcriptional regulator with XRE-family HTH domain
MARPQYEQPSPAEPEIDRELGSRIALRRKTLGMSQDALGRSVGVAFQQIQKYESGVNRISASRLVSLSHSLRVPVSWFFEGLGYRTEAPADSEAPVGLTSSGLVPRLASQRTLDLVRAFYGVMDEQVQQNLISLIRAIAAREATGIGAPSLTFDEDAN